MLALGYISEFRGDNACAEELLLFFMKLLNDYRMQVFGKGISCDKHGLYTRSQGC
jgi:hypothetical protein